MRDGSENKLKGCRGNPSADRGVVEQGKGVAGNNREPSRLYKDKSGETSRQGRLSPLA